MPETADVQTPEMEALAWLARDRRRGERRGSTGLALPMPGERDRRRAERRRTAAVVLGGGIALFSGLAAPAMAQSRSALSGARFYVDPNSKARLQADAWRATRPADAAQMDKIANSSQADWFGDWSGDVQAKVDRRVTTITAARAMPVLVAYNIPNRDCSGFSAGGAATPEAYRDWIRRFALGIAGRPAVVILEPDALAHLCGDASAQQTRLNLLWDAIQVLKADLRTLVYVDTGHSGWLSADVAASRLIAAGVEDADGFSINVSNFKTTANELAYGRAVSDRIGRKRFVVDTSRNGLGPDGSIWCNPAGRALGQRPTGSTGQDRVDAYLWVKRPGESDGTCNGGPSAGTFWADYALGLAQRAAY